MPDRQRHRGAHPRDEKLFADEAVPALAAATFELSWLLERGYKAASALALIGDRHTLRARQRLAVQRAACADKARVDRATRRLGADEVRDRVLLVDGFNVVIAIEAAISGGVLVIGRDGVLRDMASVHGSYRQVEETGRALELIADCVASSGCRAAKFWLDQPVSNSGRLAAEIRRVVGAKIQTTVICDNNPDRRLIEESAEGVVCSGDSVILDGCRGWLDLAAAVIDFAALATWQIDLRTMDQHSAKATASSPN